MDRLSRRKLERQRGANRVRGDVDALLLERFQVHLNPRIGLVPHRAMAERREVKVRSEVEVQPREDISIEGCGDAGGVVIGLEQSSLVLDELNQLTVSGLYRGAAAAARELAGDRDGAERELLARWSYFNDSGFDGIDRRAIDTAYDLAQFFCDEGRWDEAEQFVGPLHDLTLTSRHAIGAAMSRLALEARLAAREGRYAEAAVLAEQAIAGAETEDRPDATARFWLVLAEVQRAAGRSTDAEAAVAAALALYEQRGNLAAAARVRAAARSV